MSSTQYHVSATAQTNNAIRETINEDVRGRNSIKAHGNKSRDTREGSVLKQESNDYAKETPVKTTRQGSSSSTVDSGHLKHEEKYGTDVVNSSSQDRMDGRNHGSSNEQGVTYITYTYENKDTKHKDGGDKSQYKHCELLREPIKAHNMKVCKIFFQFASTGLSS